ncbi:MAG: polyribonucleotide nucleotidyltransferase [Bacteroidetes bacterium]|nr:MAG: polyribonucleotide nucleotidyltransferase [Bacteroidota bacterium]TAG87834.1 MAG: polyribonucleotide nucleotidyltransferase [Bacteroidota bacterium]
MLPNVYRQEIPLPDGRIIEIETGLLARQADGAVTIKLGNTVLLATIVSMQDAKDGIDFMPLSVDYQEKFSSTGKIPGGFLKRESKLSDYEVLISRLVDRALRPLFPADYHAETQIAIYLISSDGLTPPDCLAGLAASAALAVSDIPIESLISEVRVARVDGKFVINPTFEELKKSDLDLMVGASAENILMVEGEMKEISEEDMLEALKIAHSVIIEHCAAQQKLTEMVGKTIKRTYSHEKNDEDLLARIESELYQPLYDAAAQMNNNKHIRSELFKEIKTTFVEKLKAELTEGQEFPKEMFDRYFGKIKKKACRDFTLNAKKRLDGREYTQIRDIWCKVGYLPMPHGSAVFTRGETQSLTTVTLGTKLDEQMIDGAVIEGVSRFMLHYNFPAFSTGEVKPNRAPGRREIGHGNLAFRSLKNMIPESGEQNPYTIRIISDILESNGSSSMATVCAGTLALMDAGIKIKAPVAGIAMGMISDSKTGKYAILSDILGDEDHLGDMDFKVTGSAKGITACQMDLKVDGLSYEVLSEALNQAKQGRLHILGKMLEELEAPRPQLKPHAPRVEIIKIALDQIGSVIGPGGKIIQEIQKDSGATISIEEIQNEGWVNIYANNTESLEKAKARVKGIVAIPEVGTVYEGKVKNIQPFGAFVEFLPGKEGLLHISEIKWERLETMDGVLELGEEIMVKLVGTEKNGKYKLSRKVLLPRTDGKN